MVVGTASSVWVCLTSSVCVCLTSSVCVSDQQCVCVSAAEDLNPEEKQELENIRRRKHQLLQDIQVHTHTHTHACAHTHTLERKWRGREASLEDV